MEMKFYYFLITYIYIQIIFQIEHIRSTAHGL